MAVISYISSLSRSRSQEGGRRQEGQEVTSKDVDDWTSLDVTAGSSIYISPVGTVDMSGDTSYEDKDRTLSDIHCPPPLPILDKTGSELQKLRSLGEMALSPPHSDKDRDSEHYYETLNSLNMRSVNIGKRIAASHPDGALSSSGVWTGSVSGVSEASDRDVGPVTLTTAAEVQVRPKSSLSLGVVSDCESFLEPAKTREDDSESQTLVEENIPFMDDPDESVHSCDTEGYYTTFHDFDGFQEVANEFNFPVGDSGDCHETPSSSSGSEVIYRKKSARPSPPRRLSSLNRESLDTVVHVSELSHHSQETTEADVEVSKHLALTSRYIPSLCVVTPPLSEKTADSGTISLNVSQSTSETAESEKQGETSDCDYHVTELTTVDKTSVPVETVETVMSDLHRLSVTSTSSDVTSHSGKLVSITPDIVKPSKEITDTPQEELDNTDRGPHGGEEKLDTAGEKILPSGSGSHLPDMLSHTPEISQCGDTLDKLQDDLEPGKLLQHLQQLPQQSSKHSDHSRHDKTSWAESHAESHNKVPNTTMAALLRPGFSCDLPKLRITSPFAPYKDTTRHNVQHNESPKQNSSGPSSSALSHHQGDLERRHESENSHQNISENYRGDTVIAPSRQTAPRSGPSSYRTEDDRHCEETSNLKRSDSYRNARTILSPDLSKINRKSPDISPANKIENESYVSFNKITTVAVDSMNSTEEGDSWREDKGKGGRNFFKNIRSQFSTLSLRRSKSKKNSTATEKNVNVTPDRKSEMKRRNSFNSFLRSSSNRSPDKPRLTSTPINSENSPNGKLKPTTCKAQQNLTSEWTKSAPSFKTVAVRHQQEIKDQRAYSPPSSATYGYVQSHTGHYSQLHHHPPHHHPHHLPHHLPHLHPDHVYSNYGRQPSPLQSSGSQRSSVSSLYGLYSTNSMRRPGSVSRGSPPHSVTSDTGSVKTCECPMCYHTSHNPCRDCGCPSRSNTSSSLSVRAGDFISPSSDYYSLSPASPTLTQSDQAWPHQPQQPLYAKIVKPKASPVSDKKAADSHVTGPPKYQNSAERSKKPSAPSFTGNQEKADRRRHSWAGDKKGKNADSELLPDIIS